MRYLITGGAGFIGTHLCKKLLKDNNEVFCIDNLYTGQKSNIENLIIENENNFKFIEHDITYPLELEADCIINLACPASPKQYQNNPVQTFKSNALGAINMLELAKKLKCKILQASTSEVYGDPKIHPQNEKYWGNVNPIGIRSCYDEGKRAAETLFFDYYRQYEVNIKIIRIFNTFGPYMSINDGRVVTNFIFQSLKNKPITIYGDGNQTRSFCYIDDLIDGIIKMLNRESCTGPINLGNPEEIKIIDIAKEINELTNSKSKLIFETLRQDDPLQRKPDISLAKKILNWEPKSNRRIGLKKTIDFFKQNI